MTASLPVDTASQPFGAGSVSATLYTHGLPAREASAFLVEQAVIAEEVGFDGVTVSEHHAGIFEYLPNPMLAVAWILGATRRIWAAPCPLLLSLRSPLLVAEDLAWLAARFPARVGGGFGPGHPSTPDDFLIGGISIEQRRKIFADKLPVLVRALRGEAENPLAKDPAIRACKASPVQCMSTVGGPLGARRAAHLGIGLVPPSSCAIEAAAEFTREYRKAGGNGPIMINRRAWLGRPDSRHIESLAAHMAARPGVVQGQSHYQSDIISSENPLEVSEKLAGVAAKVGADSINIKFFFPDLKPGEMGRQLEAFGREVIPCLKRRLA